MVVPPTGTVSFIAVSSGHWTRATQVRSKYVLLGVIKCLCSECVPSPAVGGPVEGVSQSVAIRSWQQPMELMAVAQ